MGLDQDRPDVTLSADQIAEALQKAGYTLEQIQASAGKYAEAVYEEEYVELEPEFIIDSGMSVDLYDPATKTNQPHPLRTINRHDMYQSLPEIYEIARAFGKQQRKTAEEVLTGTTPEGFLADLYTRLQSFKATGRYPKWAVAALSLIGTLVSTPERKITASTLIALPNDQHDALLIRFWQVNRAPFFAWLATVLPGLVPKITMLESKVGAVLKKISQTGQSPPENTSGGQESSGRSPSVAPSKKKAGPAKKALSLSS